MEGRWSGSDGLAIASVSGGTFTGTVIAGNQTPFVLPGGSITYYVTGPATSP